MKRKYITVVFLLVCALCLSLGVTACRGGNAGGDAALKSEFAAGGGTENDPYLINSGKHWKNIGKHPDAHFKLACDINMGDEENVSPVGNAESPFTGTIDGCGYSVKCAAIVSEHAAGLFGITSGAIIKNLNFTDATVTMTENYGEKDVMASFVAIARKGTVIENCYSKNVTVSFPASSQKYLSVGGFAGSVESLSEILYCSCNVKINRTNSYNYARFYVGGFAGNVSSSAIECCSATGSVDVGNPMTMGSHLRVSAVCDTLRNSRITGIFSEMNFKGAAGVYFYQFAGDADEETLTYCLNFSDYSTCNNNYIDRYGKCGLYSNNSEAVNRYVPSDDYALANDFLDGDSWIANRFWKKGKLIPELISYEEYKQLK